MAEGDKKIPKPGPEVPQLNLFKGDMFRQNSYVRIIGPHTNMKSIIKEYKAFFDNENQLKLIMETLDKGQFLLIDETSPRNRLEDLLYIYETD